MCSTWRNSTHVSNSNVFLLLRNLIRIIEVVHNNSPFNFINTLSVWTVFSSYGYLLTFDVFKRLLMISLKFIFRLLDPLLTKKRIQKYLMELYFIIMNLHFIPNAMKYYKESMRDNWIMKNKFIKYRKSDTDDLLH